MSGQERREQLIGVARSVFAERGYEGASIEEVADRADVSKPVVYQHFGGKEGLYAVIVDRAVRDLTARITEALDAPHPRQAAEQAAIAFLAFIEEQEESFRVLVRDAPTAGGGALASVIGDVAAQAEGLLAVEFKKRGFDRGTAPMYARMLVGAVALVGEWWLEERKPARDDVAAHIVNLMWNGLKDLDTSPLLHPTEQD